MKIANIPADEAVRLAVLNYYNILDTPAEQAYDDLTRAASLICGAPIALVSFVDQERQWFKSKVGLQASETQRDIAFCAHAILEPTKLMIVEDALNDIRFVDNPLVTKDPNIRFYAGVPLVVPNGEPLGTLCVIDTVPRNLTDQQKEILRILGNQVVVLLELRKSHHTLSVTEERLHLAWQGAGLGMWDWDLKHNKMISSERLKNILGYDGHELNDDMSNWIDAVHSDDKDRVQKKLADHLDKKLPFDCELRLKTKAGLWCWYWARGQAVWDDKDKAIRMAGSLSDIEERKQDQERLRQLVEQSEQANRAKGQFLANMSHEIRTPMSGVLSTAELLAETDLTPQQKEYVTIINESGDVLQNILNDVLDYSKIDAGKLELTPKVFSLKAKIEKLNKLFSAQAAEKKLALTFELDPNNPDYLYMDNYRLDQIMSNLLSNAVKYTQHGSVCVRAAIQNIQNKSWFVFSVTDTGIGIPKDYQKTIFDRFIQVDSSANRKGTGLGLAICASLTQLMGGEIGVDGEEGRGSRFWFKIPAMLADSQQISLFEEANKIHLTHNNHKGCRALLVEDIPVNRFVLTEMLENIGCKVDVAENGQIAVYKVKNNTYDIVFMDCSMPVMDGYEATRQIRSTGNKVPIIAVTAHALSDELEKCLAVGMNDLAPKPIRKLDLLRVMDRWYISPNKHDDNASRKKSDTNHSRDERPSFDDTILKNYLATKPERAIRLAKLTRDDIERLREELFTAIANNDAKEIAVHAHALKSVTAQIGGWSFSEVCRQMETMGKSGDLSRLSELTESYCREDTLFHSRLDKLVPFKQNG